MAELHTDDTFMYENCLVGDGVMSEDPLVNRITHQRGGRVPYTFKEVVENKGFVDWDQAPTWAYWWAMDADGEAYWYAIEPEIFKDNWESVDLVDDAPTFGLLPDNWKDSLTGRPALDELTREAEEWGQYENKSEESEELISLFEHLRKHGAFDNNDPMQKQVSGSHYNKYAIQPAEYCYKNGLNNLQSEAISYITRYGDKGGKTDLEKAIHTLEMLIHMEYGEQE